MAVHRPFGNTKAVTHGHTQGVKVSRTYSTWIAMRQRCDYPGAPSYARYGGVGISYDLRWTKFSEFLKDMGERPEGTTLDRVNNDAGYSKANCRWATRKEQNSNRRRYAKRSV